MRSFSGRNWQIKYYRALLLQRERKKERTIFTASIKRDIINWHNEDKVSRMCWRMSIIARWRLRLSISRVARNCISGNKSNGWYLYFWYFPCKLSWHFCPEILSFTQKLFREESLFHILSLQDLCIYCKLRSIETLKMQSRIFGLRVPTSSSPFAVKFPPLWPIVRIFRKLLEIPVQFISPFDRISIAVGSFRHDRHASRPFHLFCFWIKNFLGARRLHMRRDGISLWRGRALTYYCVAAWITCTRRRGVLVINHSHLLLYIHTRNYRESNSRKTLLIRECFVKRITRCTRRKRIYVHAFIRDCSL